MRYFNTLPTVISLDQNNNLFSLKNLVTRAQLLPELSKNPLLFYQYTIQDGDTPESIAYKYYDDQYRYWIILHGNNTMDPQADWPLDSQQFLDYLNDKYSAIATENDMSVVQYVNETIHHYEQWITTTDNTSLTKSLKTVEIDQTTYTNLQETTQTKTWSDQSVTQQIQKVAVSLYDYEFQLNEDKRNINIIQAQYASDMEKTLQNLMS